MGVWNFQVAVFGINYATRTKIVKTPETKFSNTIYFLNILFSEVKMKRVLKYPLRFIAFSAGHEM